MHERLRPHPSRGHGHAGARVEAAKRSGGGGAGGRPADEADEAADAALDRDDGRQVPRCATRLSVACCRRRAHWPAGSHATTHCMQTHPGSPAHAHALRRSHEVVYKQAVGTHDAYLGMSGKDPSSACCEELVVRISLPEATSAAGTNACASKRWIGHMAETHNKSATEQTPWCITQS